MSSTKAKSKAAAPAVVETEPTAPAPRCAKTGRPLDQWGLPLNGPARVAALAELGMPDPNEDPGAWDNVLPVDTSVLTSTLPSTPVVSEPPADESAAQQSADAKE